VSHHHPMFRCSSSANHEINEIRESISFFFFSRVSSFSWLFSLKRASSGRVSVSVAQPDAIGVKLLRSLPKLKRLLTHRCAFVESSTPTPDNGGPLSRAHRRRTEPCSAPGECGSSQNNVSQTNFRSDSMSDVSRRGFLKTTGSVAAASAVASLTAPAPARAKGSNERLRIGFIGPGGRGFGAHV
jgi:hypothetical protein